MGDDPVVSGSMPGVELELPDLVVALGCTISNETTSIESVDGRTTIVGEAVAATADGILVLDLHPGIVMVELANPHEVGVARDSVRVVGGCVLVYPTGI